MKRLPSAYQMNISTRAGSGGDGHGRKRSRLRGLSALNWPPLRSFFTKNSSNSSRQKVSLDLALVLIFVPGQIFLHLALERMQEVGSVWFVCSTTLPEPGKGGTGNLRNVTMRLVPIFYALYLTHTMLGGGAGWGMENGWKRIGACWESKSSLERGLWVMLGQTRTDIFPVKSENPHVRGGLVKIRPLIALRGAILLEVWCRIWKEEGR